MTMHVSPRGNDCHDGTAATPFRTLQRAAESAGPGDTILVHAGIYREWVRPPRGGTDDRNRIVYQASEGEHVVITGAEPVTDWQPFGGGTWRAGRPESFFPFGNPYRDTLGGDWFVAKGRVHHAGEVYLDGMALREVTGCGAGGELALPHDAGAMTWCCSADEAQTTSVANFGHANPRATRTEIAVRPACFYPAQTGINYITVRGFEMCRAATPWAPPTAEQIGIVGPHWARGWIIENNVIHAAKCSGVSLGKERATGQNRWTLEPVKHGTQRERETVFNALRIGWSKATVGSHIVRNNEIYNCGQTGICGHLGAIFSVISDNHIHHIHVGQAFTGHEMAGIKLHAPIDTLIEHNHIHDCVRGIWLDWQAQGTRVTRNILHDNHTEDFYVEVSHGPYVVDRNALLSARAIKNYSQGGAYVHNLICGALARGSVPNRFTPYHYPHDTAVAGLMTILGGDDRFFNNLFVPPRRDTCGDAIEDVPDENAGFRKTGPDWVHGLSIYDDFPTERDDWCPHGNVENYARARLPVFIAGNLYCNGATPWAREKDPLVSSAPASVALEQAPDGPRIHVDLGPGAPIPGGTPVTSDQLGTAFQPEARFENPDGSPLRIGGAFFSSRIAGCSPC